MTPCLPSLSNTSRSPSSSRSLFDECRGGTLTLTQFWRCARASIFVGTAHGVFKIFFYVALQAARSGMDFLLQVLLLSRLSATLFLTRFLFAIANTTPTCILKIKNTGTFSSGPRGFLPQMRLGICLCCIMLAGQQF